MSLLRMIICFTLAITVHVQITEAHLPDSARLTDSCPQSNNLTAWKIAAWNKNCSEYISANFRKKDIYHCLPSIFLNETVEFCGRNVAIGKGYCPVYDYTKGATVATSRSCKDFSTGCPEPPNPPYHSLQFYKYSECWNISKTARCYHADLSCSKVKHRSPPPIDTSSESSVSWSASSEGTTPGYKTTSTTHKSQDSSMPGWGVGLLVFLFLAVCALVVALTIVICNKKRGKIKLSENSLPLLNTRTKINTSDNLNLMDEKKEEDHEYEPDNDNNVITRKPRITDASNDAINSGKGQISTDDKTKEQEQLHYNNFYFKLGDQIIKRNLIKKFKRLLHDPTDKNTPADDEDLLVHWDKKHKFWCNIWHLQELLQMCNANDLFDKCQKFARDHLKSMGLFYFTRITTGNHREILEVYTSYSLEDSEVRDKMEMIRDKLSKCLDYSLDQIRLIGVEHGCLIFVFSLPGVTIQNLKDLWMSTIWRMGVFKIETSHHIIKPDSGLQKKPSKTYVQLRNTTECYKDSCPEQKKKNNEVTRRLLHNKGTGSWIAGSNVKRRVLIHLLRKDALASLILKPHVDACIQALAQKMYRSFRQMGSNGLVYEKQTTVEIRRQTPRASRKEACKDFLQNQVLEEMEPNVILGILKTQCPTYYKDFEKHAYSGNCRREKAENLFNQLKEMKGKKFKNILNDIIEIGRGAFHSEKRNTDQIEIVKRKISSQWNDLMDEIDTNIINDTMEKLGLLEEKYIRVFHAKSGKPRKDRVAALLKFVLGNEDYLLPFNGILQRHDL